MSGRAEVADLIERLERALETAEHTVALGERLVGQPCHPGARRSFIAKAMAREMLRAQRYHSGFFAEQPALVERFLDRFAAENGVEIGSRENAGPAKEESGVTAAEASGEEGISPQDGQDERAPRVMYRLAYPRL